MGLRMRATLTHTDDHGRLDEILRFGDDERVFALVFDVVMQMIDDGGVFVVKLDAAFRRQLFNGFADVGSARHQHVAAAVDESRDGGHVQLTAECFHRRSEEDQVVVKEFTVLDERQGRIVGRFEGQLETAICGTRGWVGRGVKEE